VREIVEVYLINAPKDLAALGKNISAGDWQMVRYFAHKLKSSSHTIGFNEGGVLFQEIEDLCKEEINFEKLPHLYQHANTLCSRALMEVQNEIAQQVQ
jgi:HPt (histidine-containing phosphotransfer) domain-containing protein